MATPGNERPVIFFDGVCNLCNRAVRFVIRHDKQQQFLFASLQSAYGRLVAGKTEVDDSELPGSIVLLYHNRYYYRSDAVLQIARQLGGVWRLLVLGYILPRAVRDRLYNWVARNRYKLFGKQNECMVPGPELKSRFLSE